VIYSQCPPFDAKAKSIEGFGIVYLEAGYFAKPVIVSRIGGVVDAVHHGESGLLVDPNSAAEVTHYLLCVWDQQLRERLGRRVRASRSKLCTGQSIQLRAQFLND